jgi:hypothetical protein
MNSDQVQDNVLHKPEVVSSQFEVGICGVGPKDKTGKSEVSYWPGGNLSFVGRFCKKPKFMGINQL